jgi:hypothetical protein
MKIENWSRKEATTMTQRILHIGGHESRKFHWLWILLLLLLFFLIMKAAAQGPPSRSEQENAITPCPMCPQMGTGMMAQHDEMAKLIDQVSESAAALEKEKDPAVLKKKVAEHAALVKKLQAKFQEHSRMMQQMGPGAGGSKRL